MRITPAQGDVLLSWARSELGFALGAPTSARPDAAWCEVPAATFVTLRWADDGRLQGCIGSIEPRAPLVDDVSYNAVAAGLLDPRCEPLVLADLDALDVELSLLSPLEPVVFADRTSACAALRPGLDGVVFVRGGRRSTLLPVMWDRLPTADRFLAALMEKAGCSPQVWSDDIRLWRYTVDKHVGRAPARARAS